MNIGNTKLIRLEKIEKLYNLNNKIYAKVESTNPTGSIKDRAAYQILLDYKEKGLLKEGSTIIEATSGNTGIALAYFKDEFKINIIIVMPKSMSIERRNMILKYGAKLELVDGGMKECETRANELLNEIPNSLIAKQFSNESNSKAHYLYTAKELDNDLNDIDYIFSSIGSGGTITGIGKYFKEKKSSTKIIGIEPFESPLITKGYCSNHLIQGIGANFIPSILKMEYIDEVVTVKGLDSIKEAKTIRKIENIDCGISSGCALKAAIDYIKNNNVINKNIVIIFPDRGDRYSWQD